LLVLDLEIGELGTAAEDFRLRLDELAEDFRLWFHGFGF
jgi:hypothetical protein